MTKKKDGARQGSIARLSFVYALRNLARQPRRTALTMAAVLFAAAATIVAQRYSSAVMGLWQSGASDTGTGHAQMRAKGYARAQDGLQIDLTLVEDGPEEQLLRRDAAVVASVRRLELEGIVSTGQESMYFLGRGVEPQGEAAVSPRLFTEHDAGQFVREEDPAGVVVGIGIADSLHLKVGDEITLITQTAQGSANGIDAHVVGIVDAEIPSFPKRTIIAPLELLQRLVRMPERYTSLAVRLRPGIDIDRWVELKSLRLRKSAAEIAGWWHVEPVIRNVGRIWETVVLVLTGLLFLSTALAVLNIVYMVVRERTVEIGTLMAIGARPGDIRVIVALEAALIGLFGGAGGVMLGGLVVTLMGRFGVPFESPFGGGTLIIRPQMSGGLAALVLLAAVGVSFVAALAPAARAAGVAPVRAFRGQIS